LVRPIVVPEQSHHLVRLKPGETRRASFTLVPDKDFTHYDVGHKRYAVNGGSYELQLGASSSDIRLKSTVVVNTP